MDGHPCRACVASTSTPNGLQAVFRGGNTHHIKTMTKHPHVLRADGHGLKVADGSIFLARGRRDRGAAPPGAIAPRGYNRVKKRIARHRNDGRKKRARPKHAPKGIRPSRPLRCCSLSSSGAGPGGSGGDPAGIGEKNVCSSSRKTHPPQVPRTPQSGFNHLHLAWTIFGGALFEFRARLV